MAELSTKEKDRCKEHVRTRFPVLHVQPETGFYSTLPGIEIQEQAGGVLEANIKALQQGINFADTTEIFTSRYSVNAADLEPGTYRSIMGNEAAAMGFIAASQQSTFVPGILSHHSGI